MENNKLSTGLTVWLWIIFVVNVLAGIALFLIHIQMCIIDRYWTDGLWVETKPMDWRAQYNFDQVGEKDMYLLHHEEIESLAKNCLLYTSW